MKQAPTAIQQYHARIVPTLKRRQAFVRQQLVAFLEQYQQGPTSAELLAFVQARNSGRYDCNTIRPRLTELEQLGWVRHGVKRRCGASGSVALTWEPSTPQPPQQQPFTFIQEQQT